MKHGLIIGKFMPLHKGHLALVNFGLKHCDQLTVLVCSLNHEPIPGYLRYRWMKESFAREPRIFVDYTNKELPQGHLSTREISKVWAAYLETHYPKSNIIFSSEPYGAYLAEYMNHIEFKNFDMHRNQIPTSATQIRENPYENWDFLAAAARPFFVKKVVIYGPESTGKSTLAKHLARQFQSLWVPEIAREILGERHVVFDDISEIARLHGRAIEDKLKSANRILFIDTDLTTTEIYSQYYFQKTPVFSRKHRNLNQADLTLFCDIDCPWVADSQRDLGHKRNEMRAIFMKHLLKEKRDYQILCGTWASRLNQAKNMLIRKWPWLETQLLR
ncbi:MAG: AAA family ATPase [Spirochaetales bacterium]|nr:AAA family ATPase [Spirochaetales bacterium]